MTTEIRGFVVKRCLRSPSQQIWKVETEARTRWNFFLCKTTSNTLRPNTIPPCDGATGWEDMVDMQGQHSALFCTDVPPHLCKRVTAVAGFALAWRPLTQPALFGPSTSQAARFDCDGPWKLGDIRSCNDINALRQVFKSGTCLIIITT